MFCCALRARERVSVVAECLLVCILVGMKGGVTQRLEAKGPLVKLLDFDEESKVALAGSNAMCA